MAVTVTKWTLHRGYDVLLMHYGVRSQGIGVQSRKEHSLIYILLVLDIIFSMNWRFLYTY